LSTAASLDKLIARSGHTEQQLRVELARGAKSDRDLCRQYGINTTHLKAFIELNADAIAEIGAHLAKGDPIGLAGLWVSAKNMRIAEMQGDIEDINRSINFFRDEDGVLSPQFGTDKEYANLIRTKTGLLRSVADEIDGTRRAILSPEDERKMVRFVIDGDIAGGLT